MQYVYEEHLDWREVKSEKVLPRYHMICGIFLSLFSKNQDKNAIFSSRHNIVKYECETMIRVLQFTRRHCMVQSTRHMITHTLVFFSYVKHRVRLAMFWLSLGVKHKPSSLIFKITLCTAINYQPCEHRNLGGILCYFDRQMNVVNGDIDIKIEYVQTKSYVLSR